MWRYPVKALLGEAVPGQTPVSVNGVSGDRTFALIESESGALVSAKRPARWRKVLELRAQTLAEDVFITIPDGSRLRIGDPGVDDVLSAVLQRPVRLSSVPGPNAFIERAEPDQVLEHGTAVDVNVSAAPPGRDTEYRTFHDFAAVHLVMTSTLERLSRFTSGGPLEIDRYRPTLIVETPVEVAAEVDWPGRRLLIGSAEFDVTLPTPRCAVPMLRHGQLPERKDALRVVNQHGRVRVADLGEFPCVGVYARVAVPGLVGPGDDVVLAE